MFLSSLQLMAKRSLSRWKLLSAVVVGVLLAVAIMSTTVLYFNSLRDLALRHDFSLQPDAALDILVEASQSPVTAEMHATLSEFVESRLDARLGWFTVGRDIGVRTDTFFPANRGDEVRPARDNRRRATFVSLPDLRRHATLLEGRWPNPVAPASGGQALVVEAVVPIEAAEEFALSPGDTFTAAPFWQAAHDRVQARVVGVYRRIDPAERYWRLFDRGLGLGDTSFQFAVLTVPEETMFGALGPYLPKMGAEIVWQLDTDPSRIRASSSGRAQAALRSIRAEFKPDLNGFRMRTALGDVLSGFETRLFFNKVPMFVVFVLIVLVVLYYVATIAGLLVDAQRAEIGLLRSRGATSRQILAVYASEAFVVAALAIPVGPFLAGGAISAVGALPMFADLNDGNAIPVEITGVVFRMAMLGAVLSFLALLIPSLRAARMGLLQQRQSLARPPRLPAFQRYYLDLAALGVAVFLFWQLQRQGSFVAVRLFGEEVVNQVILAVPAMFLVVAGVVLLRIFPISMELLVRILSSRPLSRLASPALVLGLWQMARNPTHHARLSLLLILTAGLGVFAASFRGSLEQSFVDRVLYSTGADVRVKGINFPSSARGRSVAAERAIGETPGVEAISPVVRGSGAMLGQFGRTYQFLAVDPETFLDVAWTRPDFSSEPMAEALGRLNVADTTGIVIPDDAEALYVSIRPRRARREVDVLARISDAEGRVFTLNLGTAAPSSADTSFRCPRWENPDDPPWCSIGGSLSLLGARSSPPEPPLKLEFLSVAKLNDTDGSGGLQPGAMTIDEIGVRLRNGSEVLLEEFDDLTRWGSLGTTLNDFGASIAPVRDSTGTPVPGVARFSWGEASLRRLRGVLAGKLRQPVPALASRSFMDIADFTVGDEIQVQMKDREVLVKLVDTVDYFPTLDPNRSPFLVADIRSVWRALGVDELGDARDVDEYWVSIEGDRVSGSDISRRLTALRVPHRSVEDRATLLAKSELDPLSSAGWRALLAIAFFTVLVVSAIGFLVHAQVTFQGRQAELALLRATGLSMRQLLGLVLLEQAIVIGAAFAIGVFMGAQLGATIMPYLGTSGEGLRLVPPLVQQVDWGSFAILFGIVGAVFGLVVLALLISVYRMSLHRVLRLGEG